jgi:uncharacterized Fe-S cluster-containing radical SAM superfamily protein
MKGFEHVTLVCISGRMRHGKDEFSRALGTSLEARGYRVYRRAMGDALKEQCAGILAQVLEDHPKWGKLGLHDRYEKLLAIMHGGGPEKEQFRGLMQWWGTEFKRGLYWDDYWVRIHQQWVQEKGRKHKDTPIVVLVPDVRFPNETEYIRQAGGLLFRVERPIPIPANEHVGEKMLDTWTDWDAVIENNGTLEDLVRNAQAMANLHFPDRAKHDGQLAISMVA